MPHDVAFDLDLHCLPVSHKNDATYVAIFHVWGFYSSEFVVNLFAIKKLVDITLCLPAANFVIWC